MVDKVFAISGNKISAFITDDDSLMFSSSSSDTVDAFRESFSKKLSFSKKFEIDYDSIKLIKKEDNEKVVSIKYKTSVGIPSNCEFSFNDPADYEIFFAFFEKEKYFTKIHETVIPFIAIRNYLVGLIATIGFTIFTYYQAIEIANGTVREAHNGKGRLFNYVVGLLGDKGVLGLGVIISGYSIYKIWKRYSNPPDQTKLLPPNA